MSAKRETKCETLTAKLCENRTTQTSAPVKLALEMKTGALKFCMRILKPAQRRGIKRGIPFCAKIEQRGARI